MATKRVAASLQGLRVLSMPWKASRDPVMQCLAPVLSRSIATEATIPAANGGNPPIPALVTDLGRRQKPVLPDLLTTVYDFPSMEPAQFVYYPASHLHLPLRRDILHRAVIFEGDAKRQGTASTKWRDDVRGSGRKLHPQKGTGRARVGDKKSPIRRGGGVAFGPHPRDFSTDLPRKIYDLAWLTALSYRYKRGELILIRDGLELETSEARWLHKIMDANQIGKHKGRSTIVTTDHRPNLFSAFNVSSRYGKVKDLEDEDIKNIVDVKNILETGRIIIEKTALDVLLRKHSRDL